MKNNIKKIINCIAKTIILSMIVFALFTPLASAENASIDLTDKLSYKSNSGMWAGTVVDDDYKSYWYTNNAAFRYLQFECSEPITHFYVCYIFKPTELVIQTSEDGKEWTDIAYEDENDFYHVTYTFDEPVKMIKIKGSDVSQGKFGIAEVKAFSEGELPSYVQNWAPAHDEPDLMIFSAHPDDEAVFFCGLIPYYGAELDKKVTVVYMTMSEPYRRSEALNYLWSMHQTTLPLFAGFTDVYDMGSYNYTQSIWGKTKTIDYMVSVIREKKPEVIVSHDLDGEYGHGAHMFTAVCLVEAVRLANEPTYHPESYEKYGTHDTSKLYLHLYDENPIHLDILNDPLDEFNGLSSIDLAKMNLNYYASQTKYSVVRVHDDSEFSCYEYGLAYSSIGEDVYGDTLFENIDPRPTPTAEPTFAPTPTIAPTKDSASDGITPLAATLEPTEMPVSKISVWVICIIAGLVCLTCIFVIVVIIKR